MDLRTVDLVLDLALTMTLMMSDQRELSRQRKVRILLGKLGILILSSQRIVV